MDWVEADLDRAARPDPLADAAAGILEQVNQDHADALLLLARVLGGVEADEARMVAVDRLGFKLRLRSQARLAATRLPFPREARTPEAVRAALIAMLREVRTRTPA
jgi:putative heme iron utilization protein